MATNPNEAACWCSSDNKCPHNFSVKLSQLWNESEQSIDEVIQQFDKKTIRNFLKSESGSRIKDVRSVLHLNFALEFNYYYHLGWKKET